MAKVTSFDFSLTTLLPHSAGVNCDLDLIAWGAAPNEVTITDDAHLMVATLDFTQPRGTRQRNDANPPPFNPSDRLYAFTVS